MGLLWGQCCFLGREEFDMTNREPEIEQNVSNNSVSQDDSSRLWQRYQDKRQKNSRLLTTGLGLFGIFVLFLLAVGLWIIVVR